MAVKTKNKVHNDDAICFDGVEFLQFPAVTPGGAITNAAISGVLCLPTCVKIYAVAIVQVGTISVTSFNVISGIAADATPSNPIGTNDTADSYTLTAPGGVSGGYPPTLAAAGTALFAADQAVTLVTGVGQTFFNPNFDVIFPSPQSAATTANVLTLRLVASGAGGQCLVTLLSKPYDIKPYSPRTTTLVPSSDIV